MSSELITAAQRRLSKSSVPEGWRIVQLSEIFEQIVDTGHTLDLPVLSVTVNGKVVRRSSLDRKADREVPREKYLRVRPGDIAYNTMRMWQGANGLVKEEGYISPAYTVCRPQPGECAEFWAAYFQYEPMIRAFRDHSQGFAKDRHRLYFNHFATVPALRPPFAEQRKVVAILSSVSEVIERTETVGEQLRIVKSALACELLERGLPGRHKKFKMAEGEEIPEEWKLVRLGDLCEKMFVGIAQEATHAYVSQGGVPLIRTANVKPNRLQLDNILQISPAFATEMRSKALRLGDVLTARTGHPGISAVVPAELEGSQCFTLLVSRPGPLLLSSYLAQMMNSRIGKRIVRAGQAGGAQQNLNIGVFEKSSIALPEIEEQQKIVAALEAIDRQSWSSSLVLEVLHSVKTTLLQALLSGEIRVKPDETSR